ncbi:MAG: hypothetical protein ACYDEI_00160 [Erysipelotrichaceae bacterium]
MKMEFIIGMVVGALLACGGFFGRDWLKPTQQINNIKQETTVQNENKNYQQSIQEQNTIVYPNYTNISAQTNTKTNYSINVVKSSNETVTTNN